MPRRTTFRVRNAPIGAERRGRIYADYVEDCVRRIGELPARTDTEHDAAAAFAIARAHGLSIYEATYLESAGRTGAALATLDGALAKAASVEAFAVIEPLDESR